MAMEAVETQKVCVDESVALLEQLFRTGADKDEFGVVDGSAIVDMRCRQKELGPLSPPKNCRHCPTFQQCCATVR